MTNLIEITAGLSFKCLGSLNNMGRAFVQLVALILYELYPLIARLHLLVVSACI